MDSPGAAPEQPLVYASWPRRMASSVIDVIVLAAITLPFFAPAISRVANEVADGTTTARFTTTEVRTLTIASIVVQVLYMAGMHAWRGSTIGKMAMRTKLVRDDGSPVTPAVAFIRSVTLLGINFVSPLAFFLPIVLNELWPLWSPRHQAGHDVIARTVVAVSPRSP